MKNKLITLFIICETLISMLFYSCKKNSDATQFIGQWRGTSSCNLIGIEFIDGNGSSLKTYISTLDTYGDIENNLLSGTANGNNINFPKQTFQTNCGQTFTLSAMGTLNGTTLTYTFIQYTDTSYIDSCTFTGTKQ